MISHQPDLFGALAAPRLPDGMALADEVVHAAEEAALISQIDSCDLRPFAFHGWTGKRLTASFGYGYDYSRGSLTEAEPIPAWLVPLREKMAGWAGLSPEDFVQALLIRYDQGAGIGWHRDRPQFGTVLGLSLGAPTDLRLRRRGADGSFERMKVPLRPCQGYRLEGAARWEWQHSIAPMDQTRWCITFRSLRKSR